VKDLGGAYTDGAPLRPLRLGFGELLTQIALSISSLILDEKL